MPRATRRYFHGTNAELAVGDLVLPAAQTGVPQAHMNQSGTSEHLAHASMKEPVAWEFAHRAAFFNARGHGALDWRHRADDPPPPAPAGGARARVYEVEPIGTPQVGREHPNHPRYTGVNSWEYTAGSFRVKRQLETEPRAQGTLPVDWAQHAPTPPPSPSNSAAGARAAFNHMQPDHPRIAEKAHDDHPLFGTLNGAQFDEPHPVLAGQRTLFTKKSVVPPRRPR